MASPKLNTSKFVNHMRKNEILVPHLIAYFANGVFPEEISFNIKMNKERDDAFHPSSALKCSRQMYAERLGHIEYRPHTAEQQLNFVIGHMGHRRGFEVRHLGGYREGTQLAL